MGDTVARASSAQFSPAEIGALAHLYRGEMYQSKIWRNRLDATGNWAVVVTGIALSVSFDTHDASPIPLLLVVLVISMFLLFEARRYMYYDLFRVRVRVMEINFYGPMLRGEGVRVDNNWNHLLADDYIDMRFHISLMESLGRRIRRTYGWIFSALFLCYVAKLVVHPTPLTSWHEAVERAAFGPVPGEAVLATFLCFHLVWLAIALLTLRSQRAVGIARSRRGEGGDDRLRLVAGGAPESEPR